MKLFTIFLVCMFLSFGLVYADYFIEDFEALNLGNINGQAGWSKTGPYDVNVVTNTYGFGEFGAQSLRTSNAVTSGSFGDQTFSVSLVDEAGETDAQPSAYSGGARKTHFEAQFDIASTMSSQQPGLFLSVSPDRGDGARMSYVGFDDQADGIHVIFYDYVDAAPFGSLASPADGCGAGDDWIYNDIATVDRINPHTIKIVMEFVDGPRNDVVKVYVDGILKITGTSWEDYFRWCTESGGGVVNDPVADVSRTVDSLLFRNGGAAVPANSGNGYLIDNLELVSYIPSTGSGIGAGLETGIIITPEQFAPRVYLDPESRVVYDDPTEPGPIGEAELVERINNYAFEGESIFWRVLVWDKNGVPEKISDVYVKVAPYEGGGIEEAWDSLDFIEVNCNYDGPVLETADPDFPYGYWYEGEEEVEPNPETMSWYECHLTVETPASMHGEYLVGAVAVDLSGLDGQFFEQELWFFNPEIALGLDGSLNFGTVRPGGTYKSSTVALTNEAEDGSGVLLDMYLAGTDFYDPAHQGTMCPTSNVLLLNGPDGTIGTADDAFRYYATQGAYDTCDNDYADAECYDAVNHFMDGAGAPVFNNYGRIIESGTLLGGEYPAGNVLSPGADMSLNFKLALPEPCNGGPFTQGKFMFYGEAI